MTTDVDYGVRTLKMRDGAEVQVELWDTPGQESLRAATRSQYAQTTCVFLVYDITQRQSFEDVGTKWLSDIKHKLGSASDGVVFMLIGNRA